MGSSNFSEPVIPAKTGIHALYSQAMTWLKLNVIGNCQSAGESHLPDIRVIIKALVTINPAPKTREKVSGSPSMTRP